MEAIETNEKAIPKPIKAKRFRFRDAFLDLVEGVKKWRVWILLGWLDLRLRYRRSYLGPFWITISMAIMIYSMGFIYSKIFKIELGGYFLYISSGMLAWVLLSTSLLEMMNCFVDSSSFIMQVKMPYTVYILRIITRNFIVLAHNVIPIIPLLVYFKVMPNLFFLTLSLAVTAISMIAYGTLFAIVGARYRDVQQVLTSILQVCFLLTPIMWKVSMVPAKYHAFISLNPFYHYVELIRASMMGNAPALMAWKGSLILASVGVALVIVVFARVRHRLAFWV